MKKSLLFAAGLLIAAGAFAPVQAKLRMPHIFTDNMATEPGSATTARDRYYEYVFGLTGSDGPSKLAGVNFWVGAAVLCRSIRAGNRGIHIPAIRRRKTRGLTRCSAPIVLLLKSSAEPTGKNSNIKQRATDALICSGRPFCRYIN